MRKLIRPLILVVSLITLSTGVIMMIAPGYILSFTGGTDINNTSRHFFAIIGMFMFLFGALMVHSLYDEEDNRVAIFWSGLQKIGASVAVFAGVFKGIFIPLAVGVALFDLLSGLLFLYYLKTLNSHAVS